MQTFLPYDDYVECARVLDDRRLGKQRVEAYQLLVARIRGRGPEQKKAGWTSHPAYEMWEKYAGSLIEYGLAMCNEWEVRGFKDAVSEKIMVAWKQLGEPLPEEPSWIGNAKLHASHRYNLLRKDFAFYKDKFPEEAAYEHYYSEPYYWPPA